MENHTICPFDTTGVGALTLGILTYYSYTVIVYKLGSGLIYVPTTQVRSRMVFGKHILYRSGFQPVGHNPFLDCISFEIGSR